MSAELRIADARILGLVAPPDEPTASMVALGIPEYWSYSGSRGEGVRWGVIDTGADPDHSALKGRIIAGRSFVGAVASKWKDDHGHGTATAGLIAMGAPGVELVIAKVLGADGSGQLQALADALDWLTDRGCHGVNMSLGAQVPHEPSNQAGLRAVGANVVCVASAGNLGPAPNSMGWPGAYPWPLAVGALDEQAQWPAGFSSRGDELDVCAPGSRVIAPTLGGQWAEWYGTSFAAPLTSAVAALLVRAQAMAHGRAPLESRITSLLVRAARRPHNAPANWDPSLGFGLLDLRRLVPTVVEFPIDKPMYFVNGVSHPLDVPAIILNGRTMVTARPLAEALGNRVDWDGERKVARFEAVIA